MQRQFDKFNEFVTALTEHFWYLDTENKEEFFPHIDYQHKISPMHLAAKNGNVEIVQFHMEQLSIDKNPETQKSKIGLTPMHIAAKFGQLEVVQQIKNHLSISNNLPINRIQSVLHIAACYGHLSIVQGEKKRMATP